MTTEQYDRWHDFAVRMARIYAKPRSKYYPDAKWIEDWVEEFFDRIEPEDICVIQSWDHSGAYPKGHPFYRATPHVNPMTHEKWVERSRGPCLGDDWREMEWEHWDEIPLPKKVADRLERLRWSDADDADEKADAIWDEMVDRWFGQAECCVRAGIDMACPDGHGMGVLGYTAGDLRKMYPEGVPDWITGGKDHRWTTHTMAPCAVGMVATRPPEANGTFAEMPDTTEIWL